MYIPMACLSRGAEAAVPQRPRGARSGHALTAGKRTLCRGRLCSWSLGSNHVSTELFPSAVHARADNPHPGLERGSLRAVSIGKHAL